jgi:DNA-binding transcriptional regulator YiaG
MSPSDGKSHEPAPPATARYARPAAAPFVPRQDDQGYSDVMRKINTRDFRLATRSTPREVNRQIVLNLIREHQPISRADLARRLSVARSAITEIVR